MPLARVKHGRGIFSPSVFADLLQLSSLSGLAPVSVEVSYSSDDSTTTPQEAFGEGEDLRRVLGMQILQKGCAERTERDGR